MPDNSDVLPLINKLGPAPELMHAYAGNQLERTPDGLAVTFRFNAEMKPAEAQQVAAFCAAAFNVIGFGVPAHAHVDMSADHCRQTNLTLHIPDAGVARIRFDANISRQNGKEPQYEQRDDVEAQWKALRVIRQAALLLQS